MEVKLVEKLVIVPEKPTERRRIFLSNIDHAFIIYQENVSFFDPPTNRISFPESCKILCSALSRLLVPYDFVAGRLVPALEEKHRFEIDCNGAGVVFAAARTEANLSQLGQLLEPKPEYRNLVRFLHEEGDKKMEFNDVALLYIQLTEFSCGSLAMGMRYNHCVMDGLAFNQFKKSWAALSRGDSLVQMPNPDRTIFRHRNPPIIKHPHLEYSTAVPQSYDLSIACGTDATSSQTRLIYLSPQHVAILKNAALEDGKLKNCTTFQVVAAKIWKARSIAKKMNDEITSTMLFLTNIRNIIVPSVPVGFAGNAILFNFAQASVKELKEKEDSYIVGKVKEGLRRMDDEYARSAIDWLEVEKGTHRKENSFTVVAWWRLGLEENEFAWGKLKYITPLVPTPSFVFLLSDSHGEGGGLNICLEMTDAEMEDFSRLMMEL